MNKIQSIFVAILMGTVIITSGCATGTRGFDGPVANFDVVDAKVMRGAQPNAVGIDYLKSSGVTDIICLREDDYWKAEPSYCANIGIAFHHVPLNPMRAPVKESITECLRIIQGAKGKVFIHCQFGCDRTGTIVALYRITKGESNAVALDDAVKHGLSSWEIGMRDLIKEFNPKALN